MSARTFPGGIHPAYHKLTAGSPIRDLPPPAQVVIPLHQHTGAPCQPLVQKGDTVRKGQKIGDAEAVVAAPVHASLPGKVLAVEPRPHPAGRDVPAVVVEWDGSDATVDLQPHPDPDDLEPPRIAEIIREGGLVGLGGAAFPTAVKVRPPAGTVIDTYILNGAECEPFLTADHRLMVENPQPIVLGLRALMKAAGAPRAIVAIEDNKPDALEAMAAATRGMPGVSVEAVHTKYPQGSEKHLIKALLGREVPSGGLPFHVGVVVSNVGTAAAVGELFATGMPLVRRVVTVTGRVREPANLRVPIGTPFSVLVEAVGGFNGDPLKVIAGGPMMGVAQYSLEAPVVKGTSGLLVLGPQDRVPEPTSCVRCGRCVESCPMRLLPLYLEAYYRAGMIEQTEALHAMDCIECGCCGWVCPARRPLVQSIRLAKLEITARRRRAAS